MVKMVPLQCPNCHASIEVKEGSKFCYCTYCGTKILLDDDSVHTENINITHNDISAVEQDKLQYDHQDKVFKQSLITFGGLFAILIIWMLIARFL